MILCYFYHTFITPHESPWLIGTQQPRRIFAPYALSITANYLHVKEADAKLDVLPEHRNSYDYGYLFNFHPNPQNGKAAT